jgi:hypothetical protein
VWDLVWVDFVVAAKIRFLVAVVAAVAAAVVLLLRGEVHLSFCFEVIWVPLLFVVVAPQSELCVLAQLALGVPVVAVVELQAAVVVVVAVVLFP